MDKIILLQGDITRIKSQAIVNAANSSLLGGGGVDGAIHRRGGPQILEECMKIRAKQGGCPTGEAVITSAGNLPADYVIHTVGPVWNPSKRAEMIQLLANCYENSMKLALTNNIFEIVFPNISTGIYRFPKKLAAETAINTVIRFLKSYPEFKSVTFLCFDKENFDIYENLLLQEN